MPSRHATLDRLGPADIRRAVEGYRDQLRAHQEAINRLNVFPVPDGDTGTNMALTLESVVAALDGCEDMVSTCKAISHGSLMGARGNSGVILSQILRGLAEAFRVVEAADGPTLAAGLTAASEAAYGAVMKPVEGTILTVVRAAAEAAAGEQTLLDVLDAARTAGAVALANTPEQLPVLKQAGVVDAGGAGFLLLLDVLLNVVDGRALTEPELVTAAELSAADERASAGDGHAAMEGPRYEVMYFLEAPDATVPAFKDVWAGIGDSIVVVGGDGIWNCHIHTDDIGAAVEAALDCGRPRTIRVTDLMEQVEEERWVRESVVLDEAPHASEPVETAVVAVSTGAGIGRLFHSLGVQRIVTGGQSMNPSTEQLLEAVERAPAQSVVILPNNKNIIPVAEQVNGLTEKDVRVVPTRGIAEGLAAAMQYDPAGRVEDNAKSMAEAADEVIAAEVTRAVRDSTYDGGPISAGDWLGISRAGIQVAAPSLADATTTLLAALLGGEHEIVTVIEGEGATAADTRRITEWLAEHHPDVAAEVHHGGQPLYPYLFGIE